MLKNGLVYFIWLQKILKYQQAKPPYMRRHKEEKDSARLDQQEEYCIVLCNLLF